MPEEEARERQAQLKAEAELLERLDSLRWGITRIKRACNHQKKLQRLKISCISVVTLIVYVG